MDGLAFLKREQEQQPDIEIDNISGKGIITKFESGGDELTEIRMDNNIFVSQHNIEKSEQHDYKNVMDSSIGLLVGL